MNASFSGSAGRNCPSSADATGVRLGGFTPFTTTDYPGQLAAVVFCQGCPWRCGYCHNPHLIPADADTAFGWDDVVRFLDRRRGLLDAVVFSGGEPTLQRNLYEAMAQVRSMGFTIGLHTAGMYPKRLQQVLPLVDWVGMDIKAPLPDYASITGAATNPEHIRASIAALLGSNVSHEFRVTFHPDLLTPGQIAELAGDLRRMGAAGLVLQAFRPQGCGDRKLIRAYIPEVQHALLAALQQQLNSYPFTVSVRGA